MCLFSVDSLVPIEHKVTWAEAYLHTKWNLDLWSHLAATDMGRKMGAVPLLGGELGPHLMQCGQGRGLPSCQVLSWSVKPFDHKYTNVTDRQTDRQDRQTDNGPIAQGEQFLYKRSPKNSARSIFDSFLILEYLKSLLKLHYM